MEKLEVGAGRALRHIAKLGGKSYKPGELIAKSVMEGMGPHLVKTLVDRGEIEVGGMTADAAAGNAHNKARLDSLHDKVNSLSKTVEMLVAANDDLAKRMAKQEGGKAKKARAEKPDAGKE